MFTPDQYRLLDFGGRRKLEQFGDVVLDRPSPAATSGPIDRSIREQAHTRFDRPAAGKPGTWTDSRPFAEPWIISWQNRIRFELQRNSHGHLGVFPEQAVNWQWLTETIEAFSAGCQVLNLFAYTGGSTLAAARAGAAVTHVDAAGSVVQRARRNAQLSDLEDAPIRWIVDDAIKFVERELRRGRRYDGVVLDPPAYGHGKQGKTWQLKRDLPRLIELCAELLPGGRCFCLLTCHVSGWSSGTLRRYLTNETTYPWIAATEFTELNLVTAKGRTLPAGLAARRR